MKKPIIILVIFVLVLFGFDLFSQIVTNGLIYSSYLHRNNYNAGNTHLLGLCLDSKGNPIYFGRTQDTNYPTTYGVIQEKFQKMKNGIGYDDFVTKLNKDNFQIESSTFIGLNNLGWNNIIIDQEDNIYLVFENTKDTAIKDTKFFNTHKSMLIKKISSDFTKVLSSAYFGNDINKPNNNLEVTDLIVDNDNNLIIVGSCDSNGVFTTSNSYMPNLYKGASRIGYITKFSPNLDSIIFSTYHTGTINAVDVSEKSICGIKQVAIGVDNSIYVSGYTHFNEGYTPNVDFLNTPLPSKNTAKGFMSRISPDGKYLLNNVVNVYDESLRSGLNEFLRVSNNGDVYVGGQVRNNSIKTIKPCFQFDFSDNWFESVYIQKFDKELNILKNSTYFSNNSCNLNLNGIAIDKDGNTYLGGSFSEYYNIDSLNNVKTNLPITTKGSFPFDWGQAPYNDKYGGFITMLDKNFEKLEFSTTFGGSAYVTITDIELNANNYLYLGGYTYGNQSFPITDNALFKDYYYHHSFLSVISNFKDLASVDGFKIAPSNIFPNPATDYLNISFDSPKEGLGTIEIIDILGIKVCSFDNYINEGNNSIKYSELDNLQTASYTVKVTINNEIVSIGKFIKR